MNDITKKALYFASDVTKQLITLSTAVVTIDIAFVDKVFSSKVIFLNKCWFVGTLSSFIASIVFGLLTLMSLTGTLGRSSSNINNSAIYRPVVRVFSIIQMFLFIAALVMSLLFISNSINDEVEHRSDNTVKQIDTSKNTKVIKTSEYVIESAKVDTLYIYE